MHKLRCDGIPLPELYVCDSMEDARLLSESGLPFIRTSLPDVKILKLILFNTLRKMFPYIDWEKVLGVTPAEVHNTFVAAARYKKTRSSRVTRRTTETSRGTRSARRAASGFTSPT